MEVSERGFHGFRTIFRKMGRLNQEQKAALYRLLVPRPVMLFGDKAAYDALPEQTKTAFDAAVIDDWLGGMEEALRALEALEADGTVKVVRDPEERVPGSHDKNRSQETTGIHPPDTK